MLRSPIVRALAWQLIAELWRRHAWHARFRVIQSHPGISMEGQIRLYVGWDLALAQGNNCLVFNIGGPSGTCEVHGQHTPKSPLIPFAADMLSGNPKEMVDALERALGLKPVDKIPSSAPGTLAVRTLAAALGSQCLTMRPLSATLGVMDTSGGSRVASWVRWLQRDKISPKQGGLDASDRWADLVDLNGSVAALHLDKGLGPVMDDDSDKVLLDLDSGLMFLAGSSGAQPVALTKVYEESGRKLSPLVSLALAHLGV